MLLYSLMQLLTRLSHRKYVQEKRPYATRLFSAGGRSGRRLAEAAVRRGHEVTALARAARRVALAQTRRASAMSAPSCASRNAIARPIPWPAPVTRTTLPLMLMSLSRLGESSALTPGGSWRLFRSQAISSVDTQ